MYVRSSPLSERLPFYSSHEGSTTPRDCPNSQETCRTRVSSRQAMAYNEAAITWSVSPSCSLSPIARSSNIRGSVGNRLILYASSSISISPGCSGFRPHSTSRRSVLLSTIALPLLIRTQKYHLSSAEDFIDPAEQALFETLSARESLTVLCEDIKSLTQRNVSNAELQDPKRALGEIYESLEVSLPKVAEEFELEEDIIQELLESVACANDVFVRSCFTTNPSSGLDKCSKFLELACVQMDEMLEQVPTKTLQSMLLLRGIRPIA
ncbi:hypothetical protein KP509_02G056200 [Ceratopteris richardii]|uniref:Uncharacterized protein n=1 Tax=Ceratopteris richardii TaxID=49495 RepID=A0A8T2VE96_CERRI|nr:hypothetical protein KP509_02G056200 [Ceratopteris richardii]